MRQQNILITIFTKTYYNVQLNHLGFYILNFNNDIFIMKTLAYLLSKNIINKAEFDFLNFYYPSNHTF